MSPKMLFMNSIMVLIVSGTVLLMSCDNNTAEKGEAADEVVPYLTADNFSQFIEENEFSLVEFGGKTCIPCQEMQPILRQLKSEYGNDLNIANVSVHGEGELASQYQIRLIPTQIIFNRDGRKLSVHMGFWEKDEIVNELRKLEVIE